MLDTTQFSNDILSLADTHQLNEFNISTLIEKYTAGQEILVQQEIRRQMLAELQRLKAEGLIEYNDDQAREIKGMSEQVFRRNSLKVRGTKKRQKDKEVEKYNAEQRELTRKHLEDFPKQTWYRRQSFIWLIVGLILGAVLSLMQLCNEN